MLRFDLLHVVTGSLRARETEKCLGCVDLAWTALS